MLKNTLWNIFPSGIFQCDKEFWERSLPFLQRRNIPLQDHGQAPRHPCQEARWDQVLQGEPPSSCPGCSSSQSQIDAEKTPFLCDRLKIRTIPTVIMIKDSVTRGYIVGFTDLGNTDEFSTEMLAWRLGHVSLVFSASTILVMKFS